jgi:mRNA interferase MazF
MVAYIPARGDVVFLNCDPQAGTEIAGKRPALVLSQYKYNQISGRIITCPITATIRKNNFEVVIPKGYKVSGVIISDQIKSFDWKAREAKFICKLPDTIVLDAIDRFSALIS